MNNAPGTLLSPRILALLIACVAASCLWTPSMCRAAGQQRPNVLLAISDDQSYPHASAYGDRAVSTPAFDRVARQGVLFRRAYCASPGCSPSRAALLTGRHTWQLENAGTHASSFSSRFEVFPDILERAGYAVGYTGKGWGPGNFKAGGRTRNPAGAAFAQHRLDQRPTKAVNRNDYAANFEAFLDQVPGDQPFCFWYGASEPHRSFEAGSGKRAGGDVQKIVTPSFLPDTPEIREDLLDYCLEIEHFDRHLGRMLDILQRRDALDDTVVIVTSDNGMAFPRAKANCYEYGIHVPLAIAWPSRVPGGREVDDLVGFVDLAPTILQEAGLPRRGTMSGRGLLEILSADAGGQVGPPRAVFSARERHSSSRHNNNAYPQRSIRKGDLLLIHNMRPQRWPAGAPRKMEKGRLGPEHGGYHDIDACPTLTFLIENRDDPQWSKYFHWAVDKRPEFELYNVERDPGCLDNLAERPEHADALASLQQELRDYLRLTGDPRVLDGGEIFETYRRYSPLREFPSP